MNSIQLDSLVRAVKGGLVKIDQVPKDLQEQVKSRLDEANKEK